MMKKIILVGIAVFFAGFQASAEVRFKNIYQSNMLLQADEQNAIAGWSDPHADVELYWTATAKDGKKVEKSAKTKSDKRGYWELKIPAFPKRTILELTAKSGNESVRIDNIITGELWLGSGQSNMEWNFGAGTVDENYRSKIQADIDASAGEIRFFKTHNNTLIRPIDEVSGTWSIIKNPRDGNLSAVGYLFSSRIRNALDTPVGFINSSWGGTRIEPWISQKAFENSKDCKNIWNRHVKKIEEFEKVRANYYEMSASFFEKNPTPQRQNQNRDERPPEAYDPVNNKAPSVIYNAKIHGIAPLSPKGVLWYQGESNEGQPDEYGKLAKLLVESWRTYFKRDFWFFYVELAAFQNKQTQPVEGLGRWGYIREAQSEVLELPKTDVAANSDMDPEPQPLHDIHPPYKDVPAERLANLALAHVYKKIPEKNVTAPFYKSHKIEGGKVFIDIECAEGLKKTDKAERLTGFAMRGDGNDNWKWAEAEIKGNKLIVYSSEIQNPEAVRYGWAQNPLLSIENKHGLPLRPFSTDNAVKRDYASIKRD